MGSPTKKDHRKRRHTKIYDYRVNFCNTSFTEIPKIVLDRLPKMSNNSYYFRSPCSDAQLSRRAIKMHW